MSEVSLIVARSVITFCSLLIFARLLGKTQISHLSFFEYVAGITMGSIAGSLTTDLDVPPFPLLAGLATWAGLTLVTQWTALKSRLADKLLDGEPVLVIQNGQVLEQNLRQMRLRVSELLSLLRNQGIFDISEVAFAIMEINGTLSVLKRDQPVTTADLKLPAPHPRLSTDLIVDGEVVHENLRHLGLPQSWLMARLRERGIASPRQVFLAVVDTEGDMYLDTYADRSEERPHQGVLP
ncbi:MAG TPA: DUF421 domain-containing protein [Symbiobacteriaceae bacterium]|nr:DUF421 domain-containing protein [Symbiobacteriaceae bacterium]